ncbi:isoaspartyl peptidase/L-asparaginase family protein [Lysobacter sp. N42]|uniref:isoaspartyl peptidase/L-asparaginase family protein n=1 Tax=Lysobacter sp. N42 TaxID=2545719 RepID=UPI001045D108|nr:isoaspartyl peptidase/L-asparaginase [Lysobacter sp. N42]TCZ84933.1 isoaspartyl peptidase/L-asparaginase [Lysobacter sp. N42]
MRALAALALSLASMTATAQPPAAPTGRPALVVHGGAGFVPREALSPADLADVHATLNRALDAGDAVLRTGGSALDAVTAAVRVLEESPRFNAGKGAVFNARGGHELDASIMDGSTRRAGSVAGVTTVRNPIRLARAVMEKSPHVMLAGAGAEAFADTLPEIERVPNAWFDTPHRREQLEKAQRAEKEGRAALRASDSDQPPYFGTVGAVALDREGRIAAATSTGGMTNKRWGRVGDSPVIGAGTWADERCGVSGTGWGEYYIRAAAAHDICARVAYRGDSLQAAADEVINRVIPAMGGDGGAIALDREGNIAMPFNSGSMFRGWIRPDGSRGTAVHEETVPSPR